ncbi:MAG: aminopeptidase N [Mycobacterium leprae]
MPGSNLTRDEAQTRARLVHVASTTVDLDLTGSDVTFSSRTTIRFDCSEPGAATFVELIAPTVREVVLNGRSLDPGRVFDGTRVHLDGLTASNELTIVADCAYMRTGEGLHRFVDPVDGAVYLYTQFETSDAQRMYACFDQPDLKTTFELSVTAPPDWEVVSNSPGHRVESPAAARWQFRPSPRVSTYITALVAGPYAVTHDRYDGRIPLGVYCRRSLAEFLDAAAILEVTKQGFAFFERTFDYPYPFEKYDQLFVPEFNAGAMENAGCVTILEDYVFRSKVTDAAYERRAETILHEMAHMWFGDLVTMRWWDDLWLNESFATYMAALAQAEATRWRGAWTTFANVQKTWAYRQDQLPSTHPIVADIEDIEAVKVNFDGITYAKGASVLKQLVAWVGRDRFLEAMRVYFRRHEWSTTTLHDLLSALEEASGRDLSAWSKQWLETAGVNTLRPEFTVDPARRFTSFEVRQDAVPEHPTLRSHRVAIGLYDDVNGSLVRRDRVELDVVGAQTEVPGLVGATRPDLVLVNDDDLTYAKIRLDEHSFATVTSSIGAFVETLPRALCWGAAWDMTRDAEVATRDYLTLVLGGIGAETEIGVVQTLLRQVKLALDCYAAPEFRPVGLERLAGAARAHLAHAAPGSDLQLAWARTFASAAASPEHLATVRGLLSGTVTVEGLAVDTELRWHLLHNLVARGAAGDAEIEVELARDRTAAGERHAAAARAARPTAQAKAEAWAAAVERDDLPTAVQAAIISGFQQPDQQELLRPYVERYFAVVAEVWASRTIEVAQNIVVGLFPSYLVEQSVVDRTDAFLERERPVPALRRLILEGRAGVPRALRARARDAREPVS